MMRRFGAVCGAVLGLAGAGGNGWAVLSGISHRARSVRRIQTHVVTLDLKNPAVRVSVALANGGIGRSERFERAVARTGADVAVTGTCFDPRTLRPVGDLVINGRFVHRGFISTSLAFRGGKDAGVEVRYRTRGKKYPGYSNVVTAGPRILRSGRWAAAPRREGFRDPALLGRHRRVGAEVTRHGKLLLFHPLRPGTLSELGKIVKDLGAVDAINLDGGSSSALYYRGRILARPGRRLTNLLIARETSARRPCPARDVGSAAASHPARKSPRPVVR